MELRVVVILGLSYTSTLCQHALGFLVLFLASSSLLAVYPVPLAMHLGVGVVLLPKPRPCCLLLLSLSSGDLGVAYPHIMSVVVDLFVHEEPVLV